VPPRPVVMPSGRVNGPEANCDDATAGAKQVCRQSADGHSDMSAGVGGIFTTIAAFTGAGAFIDFYVGKEGQKRVKDWLETWWYRLSDIPVRAVGREEALNALRVIDYLFGPKLFSWKRLKSATIFKSLSLCVFPVLYIVIARINKLNPEITGVDNLQIVIDVFIICLSFSISRGLIAATIFVLRKDYFPNLAIALTLLVAQLLLFVYFGALTVGIVSVVSNSVRIITLSYYSTGSFVFVLATLNGIFEVIHNAIMRDMASWTTNPVRLVMFILTSPIRAFDIKEGTSIVEIHMYLSGLFDFLGLNLFRAPLALLFFGSYLLVPVWPRMLTLYARIIESDKPVFTLVGAGIGGFASAVAALLK
jgi:hypothetical protein